MRFSEAAGRQVVSTATAETVGKVDGFVVDPRSQAVVALSVKKTDGGDTVVWTDIVGFGADAVTVSQADKISDASPEVDALTGKDHELLGKRILSAFGDELGKVSDVEFDPASGRLTTLFGTDDDIAGDRLIGVGSYAVVVEAGTRDRRDPA